MAKAPCDDAPADWWIRVHTEHAAVKAVTKSGKWLLYIHCSYIQRVWSRVVADVRAELLGPEAKVSTHKPSPFRRAAGQHVICVYTQSLEDEVDVLRVAKRLVTTAELKKARISYKSDAQTLEGEYSWNAADGVALYTFGPPYETLEQPRARPGPDDSDADGRCGGCGRPVSVRRRKCPRCGWVFSSDPLACLARDDLPPFQRQAIELELQAVAQTGPKNASESAKSYAQRVQATLRRLALTKTIDR